ncbi:unnamed protein product [Arabidopsis halleri]
MMKKKKRRWRRRRKCLDQAGQRQREQVNRRKEVGLVFWNKAIGP